MALKFQTLKIHKIISEILVNNKAMSNRITITLEISVNPLKTKNKIVLEGHKRIILDNKLLNNLNGTIIKTISNNKYLFKIITSKVTSKILANLPLNNKTINKAIFRISDRILRQIKTSKILSNKISSNSPLNQDPTFTSPNSTIKTHNFSNRTSNRTTNSQMKTSF